MDLERRLELISRDPTEEIVVKDELISLLKETKIPKHYIGIEISGLLHLGSLVLTGSKINDFLEAQIDASVFLADWHTYINDKLGGDWLKIRETHLGSSVQGSVLRPEVNCTKITQIIGRTWSNLQNI